MRSLLRATAVLFGVVAILGMVALSYVGRAGLSARDEPTAIETMIGRNIRRVVVARQARGLTNPVGASEAALADARAHYADHCAGCHANDGSGDTEMGRGLFPKAPDMRLAPTQDLSDGELFWIIENGIRFTGMPGWSTGTPEGADASWKLVHFIRRLPTLSPEEIVEMEGMNPRSPDDIRQELEEERFLEFGDVAPATPPHELGGAHD